MGKGWSHGSVFPALLFALGAASPAPAQELPLFDAHIHYNREAWQALSPAEAVALFDQAGIRRALVSSTPDEGTWKLYRAAPDRIVPLLRLYRGPGDLSGWTGDSSLIPYLEQELASRDYRGIGEVHLDAGDVEAPVVERALELVAERDLIAQVHTGEAGMEALLRSYPEGRFLWAHAGLGAPAAAVRRLLEDHPNLWVELSLRYDVAPEGSLDTEWRELFLDFPDRFVVGTDTWVNSRWNVLEETARFTRRWLRRLPADVAEKIAYRNGERLFSGTP
jgi:predicted TIM-barrel fold metal-dependent hydrolase